MILKDGQFFENEKLEEEQLDNVVGGAFTVYVFGYVEIPGSNKIMAMKAPVPISTPVGLVGAMLDIWGYLNKTHPSGGGFWKETTYDEYRAEARDFAKEHASRWNNPTTWGNIVITACADSKRWERFTS